MAKRPKKQPPRKKRVSFALFAPDAKRVTVSGTFCDWQTDVYPMAKDSTGTWKTTRPLEWGRYEYRFFVDGQWRDDPNCTERVANPHGSFNCVLRVGQVADEEEADEPASSEAEPE
jgi:1,4-alpha-glucan branching enzyme